MRNERNDQIFTPIDIAHKMLDLIGYTGDNIRTKTIFEPSFGAGVFLDAILSNIVTYANENNLKNEEIIKILNNVHGLEIDKELFEETKKALIVQTKLYGIDYNWPNLICGDTTKMHYDKQFDFCIGNPPYIRVHDLNDSERRYIEEHYEFGQGNTDLYITFFELGLKSIKDDGKLCFITPNSFFKNSSQKEFRKYLLENKLLDTIVDYGDVLVFDDISTYTAITLLNKNHNRAGDEFSHPIEYTKMKNRYVDDYTRTVSYEELNAASFVFVSSDDKDFLEKSQSSKEKLSDLCDIQYGLATNADKVYIVKKENVGDFEKGILRPVVKGSTLNDKNYIIFPYTWDESKQRYDLINEATLQSDFPKTYAYLSKHKDRLLKRDLEKDAVWYQYGRSQGIQSSNKDKIIIKQIISEDAENCEIKTATNDVLVYSGLFITLKEEKNKDKVIEILQSKELCRYLKLVGKDMSGGYKSFNGKALKEFGIITKEKNNTMFKLFKNIFYKNDQKEKERVTENENEDATTVQDDGNDLDLFEKTSDTISLEEAICLYKPDFEPKERKISKAELQKLMLYAVALGDISGSRYEGSPYPGLSLSEIMAERTVGSAYPEYHGWKTIDLFTEEHHFTDDTVLSIAIFVATREIMNKNIVNENEIVEIYTKCLREYTKLYPDAGFAAGFEKWAFSDTKERNYSYGNGACMRVSGIATLFDNVEDVIKYAYYAALPSHSHVEGIKGSVCTAVVYWMLIFGANKNDILEYIKKQYPANDDYAINGETRLQDLVNMNRTNPWSTVSVICQTSLVEAVINFVESDSFERCLRNGYKYLCDRDTISAIAAPMAALYYQDISVGGYEGEKIVEVYLDDRLLNELK